MNAIQEYFELIAIEMANNLNLPVEMAKEIIMLNGLEFDAKRKTVVNNKEQ